MRNSMKTKGGLALALALSLTGCGPQSAPPEQPAQRAEAACEQQHPYPCGGEWPEGLAGPFELGEVIEVRIPGHDGTMLHGWVAFPTTPGDVRLPTILSSSPYYDSPLVVAPAAYRDPNTDIAAPVPGATGWWDEQVPLPLDVNTHSAGFPPIRLIRQGYALAYVSVRGTGSSQGCMNGGGTDDQLDQRAIIEWIASQDWSNGRVGMVGLSAPSYQSWGAAVEAPTALKTIVTAGDFLDPYQVIHTPQGARSLIVDYYYGQWTTTLSLDGGLVRGHLDPTRAGCEGWRPLAEDTASLATGDRNAQYWLDRGLSARLSQVRAAVLDTSGYYDLAAHAMQDSMIWGSLPRKTPRVAIRGWWGHGHPAPDNPWHTRLDFPSGEVEWEAYVTRWFDYWLKGIGPEPRTGVVYHQDQTPRWHEAESWSPEPSKKEVLYLSPQGFATTPGQGSVTFRSAPHPLDAHWMVQAVGSLAGGSIEPDEGGMSAVLCPSPADASLSHLYQTPALEAPVLLAGNPFAFMKLSSDQPGGLVTVTLYDLAPEFACTRWRATGARYIASGSADLEFYSTPYQAHAFPVATPVDLRIDLSDVTYLLEPGHRLALAVSSGAPYERAGSLYTPNITIDGVGELVVPVVEGTLGGERPKTKYPQRPFTPDGYED